MKGSLKYLFLLSQVGLTILTTVLLFTLLGVYLDRRWNTKGILIIFFLLFGSFAAIWSAYQLIIKTLSEDSERK
ncbi:MAG: AtpZ/AtpI family protein [Firmicutes bacterium]|nr:AtpZ/AtpI family protein [Bacillota bacterium]